MTADDVLWSLSWAALLIATLSWIVLWVVVLIERKRDGK